MRSLVQTLSVVSCLLSVVKEKESSWPISRVLYYGVTIASVIYLCLLLPAGYSGLPSGSGEQPSNTGIHDLATPGTHSSGCHHPDWWALTPPSHPYLTCVRRLFSSTSTLPSPTPCTLTSGMLYVARTFLILLEGASDRPSNCFRLTKIVQAERNAKSQRVKVEKKLAFPLLKEVEIQ